MLKYFPKNKILLTPDIVLSTRLDTQYTKRRGTLLCLRQDQEGILKFGDKSKIINFLNSKGYEFHKTDTVSSVNLFTIRSKKRIYSKKISEFKTSQLVITDRLHGMVFAAITATPCIAISNYNHKVLGTFEWLKNLPYIYFCNSIEELPTLVSNLDLKKKYHYEPSAFKYKWGLISKQLKIEDNE
jgi:pyruvyl transferase EpsI